VSKKRSRTRPGRRLKMPFGATIVVAVVLAAVALARLWTPASRCEPLTGNSDALMIDVQHLKPGAAVKYCWNVPDRGPTVRFIVARRTDGGIVSVLDACRVCYLNKLGYKISKSGLWCSYCGNRYSIDSLSVNGLSCSPFKLPSREDHGSLKIKTSDLRADAAYFPAQPFTDAMAASIFGWFGGTHQMKLAAQAAP
jgi:uncharacterized membrane protein